MTLEMADIESVTYGGHESKCINVRGYQNYDITPETITPLNNPTHKRPWVDTKVKSNFLDKIILDIKPQSFADFGSNLGYYVFQQALQGVDSLGVDYSAEYIGVCESIKNRFNITGANFLNCDLETWCRLGGPKKYDLITVFNVIHHLYNRTEKYMDMNKLVMDFRSKTSGFVLFEFPTEKDKKGHKWTMDTDYTEAKFYASCKKVFSTVKKFEGQTKERPFYLCKK